MIISFFVEYQLFCLTNKLIKKEANIVSFLKCLLVEGKDVDNSASTVGYVGEKLKNSFFSICDI